MKRKGLLHRMKGMLSVVLAVSLAMSGMQGWKQSAQAETQEGAGATTVFTNYITRSGSKLMEGNQEFKFVSLNYPQATSDTHWEHENAIKTIRDMGGKVTRSYTIPVTNGNNGSTAYVTGVDRNGKLTFNEDALNQLDDLLAVCNKYGVRLIIPLVDHWHWVGGMDGYVWLAYGKDAAHQPSSGSFQSWAWEFYSNEKCIDYFEQMITHLMNRVNTVSGVMYKDDPAVICWETGNEVGAGPTYQTTYDDILTRWNKTIVNHIKAQGIKQLVLDGRMSTTDKSRKDNPADILGAHYYEGNYTTRCANDTQTAHAAGYPFILGEFGGKVKASDCTPVFQAGVNNGTNGIMMWSLRAHKDGFGYYFHDEDGYWAAYHWPGFPTGDYYGETEILRALYAYAQIANGKAFNYTAAKTIPIPAPETDEAPLLYNISTVGDIKWRGVVGGAWYEIQRADGAVTDQNSDAWTTIAGEDEYVYDSGRNWEDKAHDCIRGFHDQTALTGETYSYRLRACNESGTGPWSNIVTVQDAKHVIFDDLDMIAVSSTDRNPTELRNVYSYDHSANVTLSGSAVVNTSSSTGYIGYKAIIPIESVVVNTLSTVSAGNEPKIYVSADDNLYMPVEAVQAGEVFTVADVQTQAGNTYYVRVYIPGKSACKVDSITVTYNNTGVYNTGSVEVKSNVMIQDNTFGENGAKPQYIFKSANMAAAEGGLTTTDDKNGSIIYKTGDDINAYRVIAYNQNGKAPIVEVSFDGIEYATAPVLATAPAGEAQRVIYGDLDVKDSTRVIRITCPAGGDVKIASVELSSGSRSIPLADASPANTLEDGEYYFGEDANVQSTYTVTTNGKTVTYEKQMDAVDYASYDSLFAWIQKNNTDASIQFVLKDAAGKTMTSQAYSLSGSTAELVKMDFSSFTKASGFDLTQVAGFAAVVTAPQNVTAADIALSSKLYTGNYGIALKYNTAQVNFDTVYVSSSSKVDDFEGYSGSSNLLNAAYKRNTNGGAFNLSLDSVHKYEGSYGLKVDYNYDGKGYAGATKTMDLLNLGGYDGFMLYCESDGSGNQIKIQVDTDVYTFSYTGYLTAVGPMIMYMPFKGMKEEQQAGPGHVLDQNSNLKSVSIYTNQESSVTSGTLYFDDIKGANFVDDLENRTEVTLGLADGTTVTEYPYTISGTAAYVQYVCLTIGEKSINVPVKDGVWSYELNASSGIANGTNIPVKAGVSYPNGEVIQQTAAVKMNLDVQTTGSDEEGPVAAWTWDFGTNGTSGWTFSGFTPKMENGSLISWSTDKYDLVYSHTVTGLPNGIYTLNSDMKVKSSVTYAYMGLQNTAGVTVKSQSINTDDAFVSDISLGSTIEVKDGQLTVFYEAGAPQGSNGATFGIKRAVLYKVGELSEEPNTPDVPEAPKNYIVNGDMSSVEGDWPKLPTSWNASYTGGDGYSAIKVEDGEFIQYAGAASAFTLSQNVTLPSGKYELSADISLLNPDTANSVVMSVTADGEVIVTSDVASSLEVGKYVTVKLPEFDASGTVTVQFAGDFRAKGLKLDNVTLYRIGDATPVVTPEPEKPTNYIINGDMSSVAEGWPNLPTSWNAAYTGGDGHSAIKVAGGVFVQYADAASAFTLSQDVKLPSGKYELSADIMLNGSGAGTAKSVTMKVLAGDKEVAVLDVTALLVAGENKTFTVPSFDAEGTVTVQIAGDFTGKGLSLDNVTLYRIGDATPVVTPEPEKPTNHIVNGDMSSVAEVWPNLPTSWNAAYTGGDPSQGSPIKVEGGVFVQYAEKASTFTLSQDVTLPSGKYELSADIMLNGSGAGTAKSVTMKVLAGDKEVAVLDVTALLVAGENKTFTVPSFDAEGTVTVQIAGDFTGKGLSLDNVTLYRIGDADPVPERLIIFNGLNSVHSICKYPVNAAPERIDIPTVMEVAGYKFLYRQIDGIDGTYGEADAELLAQKLAEVLANGETGDILVRTFYQLISTTFTVEINGGEGSGTYDGHAQAWAKAPTKNESGEAFAYWQDSNGTIISYRNEYAFFVDADMKLTAVYDAEVPTTLGISSIESITTYPEMQKILFVSVSSVPDECTLKKAGIIATSVAEVGENRDIFTEGNAQYVRYVEKPEDSEAMSAKYSWTKSKVNQGDIWYVRGYVVYTDANGNERTVYGDLASITMPATSIGGPVLPEAPLP